MNKYNVLFIFVDSVRTYFSDDDRSRLKIMDEFAAESVECLNVVTSAPSTFMSISAMMTGMPAYCLNRNYDDFKFDNNEFISLPYVLKSEGYATYNFWMAPISRVTMSDLLPGVSRKYWPKGFQHSEWWSNSKINKLVENTLNLIEHHNKPNFFFVNYNCREDEKTSEIVSENLNLFRKYGYTKENTITILCSDHGYPDSSKATGSPSFYKLNNVGHDLVLTDDNIMIPFSIQYPGAEVSKIESTFSTLDIFPTILDILKINLSTTIEGKSMLPVIEKNNKSIKENENRFHRCDSRLAFQKGKGTAIRNSQFKYIYYHDNFFGDLKEEFFNLIKDPLEEVNLIDSKDSVIQSKIITFKQEFTRTEDNAMRLQENVLQKDFNSKYSKDILNAKNIVIVDSAYHSFINFLTKATESINLKANVKILNISNKKNLFNGQTLLEQDSLKQEKFDANEINKTLVKTNVDLIIFPSSNINEDPYQTLLLSFQASKVKILMMNYNLINNKDFDVLQRVKISLKQARFLIFEPFNLLIYIYRKLERFLSLKKK